MEIEMTYKKILFHIINMDDYTNIFWYWNILCTHLTFTANMKKQSFFSAEERVPNQRQ